MIFHTFVFGVVRRRLSLVGLRYEEGWRKTPAIPPLRMPNSCAPKVSQQTPSGRSKKRFGVTGNSRRGQLQQG